MKLFSFQAEAIDDLQKPNKHIVVAGVGCFTGDTKVRINSAREGRQTTIKNLYLSWHGLNPHSQHTLKKYNHTYIRGWRNGRVGLNKIKDVVCLGKKRVVRLEFSDGTVIRCTPDHKFMAYAAGQSRNNNQPEWIEAKDLLGCNVAKDSPHTKRTKRGKKQKDTYIAVPDSHPYAHSNNNGHKKGGRGCKRIEFHRAVYEAKLNGFDDVYDWRDHIGVIPMDFVNPQKYHIHHKDHNHYNNDPENLIALPANEHLQLHASPENFHQGEVEYIRCTEIEECGEETVYDIICEDVHSYTANDFVVHNCGKGAIMLHWLRSTGKKKWLVVATASKRDSGDIPKEAVAWFGEEYVKSLSLTVISWQALAKWTIAHWDEIEEYAFAFDECQKFKHGVSSARGRAVLQITKRTNCWTGYTGTPGDNGWIDYQAYFIAGGYVKNKTQFLREFCQVQTFKGYPEIVGYHGENVLREWWRQLTVAPDTSAIAKALPPERHYMLTFKADKAYQTFTKTRLNRKGEFLETTGAVCAEERRLAVNKAKWQWLADYISGLGTNCIVFYALNETGDLAQKLIEKELPKGARVWRIRGGVHQIPTEETIGKYDVVLCQWEAASESLNLQFINEWVSLQPCYSYSTSEQARGRIKRNGQTHDKMEFYYLKTEGTIEDGIYRALKTKSEFSEENWIIKETKERKVE